MMIRFGYCLHIGNFESTLILGGFLWHVLHYQETYIMEKGPWKN